MTLRSLFSICDSYQCTDTHCSSWRGGGSLARPESPAVRRSWSSRGSRQRHSWGCCGAFRDARVRIQVWSGCGHASGSSARSSHRLEAGLAATAVVRARKSAPKAERCGFSEGGVLPPGESGPPRAPARGSRSPGGRAGARNSTNCGGGWQQLTRRLLQVTRKV